MAKRQKLIIIIKDESGDSLDMDIFGDSRTWKKLGYENERKTSDGKKVVYEYFHDLEGKLPDAARAILYRKDNTIKKIAYLNNVYSEDFSMNKKLNRMLDIRVNN